MSTERIIGIDFGTSTSVVRVKTYIDGKPEHSAVSAVPIKFDSHDTLPTLIHWDNTYDEYSVGYEAENQMHSGIGEIFRNFKLDLLSSDTDTRKQAETLVMHFFNYIYDAYTEEQDVLPPCDSETTYVSYPAKWPKEICDTMVRIAKEAGFKNVKGIDEPSAAIHTVLIQKGDELEKLGLNQNSLNILMVDMGAGTTDLALCRYTVGQKNVEILNTWPKADSGVFFGGREIDESLWNYVKQYLTDCGIPEIVDEKRYLSASKEWKESNVSPTLKKNRPDRPVECGFISAFFVNMGGSQKPFPTFDRTMLENMLSGYLKQFPALINGLIENTENFSAGDVDLVILTGGHSQWYFADEILSGALTSFGNINLPKIQREPERIIKLSRPQETVALGMVYQPMNPSPLPVQPSAEMEKNTTDNSTTINETTIDKKIRAEGKLVDAANVTYGSLVIEFEFCEENGFIFIDAILEKNIPSHFIKYVEKALSDCLAQHNKIKGLKATLVDLKYKQLYSTINLHLEKAAKDAFMFAIRSKKEWDNYKFFVEETGGYEKEGIYVSNQDGSGKELLLKSHDYNRHKFERHITYIDNLQQYKGTLYFSFFDHGSTSLGQINLSTNKFTTMHGDACFTFRLINGKRYDFRATSMSIHDLTGGGYKAIEYPDNGFGFLNPKSLLISDGYIYFQTGGKLSKLRKYRLCLANGKVEQIS